MKTVLFVSHKKSQCGVYVLGTHATNALTRSEHYQFIRVECESLDELLTAVAVHCPDAIIYNYMHILFPWMADGSFRNSMSPKIIQIGIAHDVTSLLFDYNIALDPTLPKELGNVYGIGRLIPEYENTFVAPNKLTIGSFGFGTPGKGFERIVPSIEHEFDEAIIRFNIPYADFGDKDGNVARGIAEGCKAQVTKPGVQLTVTHDYWEKDETLLDFLAQNTINVFFYEDMGVRGIASVIDMALAAQRPIAISDSVMFRHMRDVEPSICVAETSLKEIISNGFAPLQGHRDKWSVENFIHGYEDIMDSIFQRTGDCNGAV
uniref:Glycosyltransferase n=1 Tax=viral metagenome TaxID=1070528 RepID=A0A6M3M3Y2_9ZZZZ